MLKLVCVSGIAAIFPLDVGYKKLDDFRLFFFSKYLFATAVRVGEYLARREKREKVSNR
jgi:hypothetical protein